MGKFFKNTICRIPFYLIVGVTLSCTPTIIRNSSRGNYSDVKQALDAGAFIDARDSAGNTALMKAVSNGHFRIVKLLIERGANTNTSVDGWTILMEAARKGNLEIFELLLNNGADSNAVYEELVLTGPREAVWVYTDPYTGEEIARTKHFDSSIGGANHMEYDINDSNSKIVSHTIRSIATSNGHYDIAALLPKEAEENSTETVEGYQKSSSADSKDVLELKIEKLCENLNLDFSVAPEMDQLIGFHISDLEVKRFICDSSVTSTSLDEERVLYTSRDKGFDIIIENDLLAELTFYSQYNTANFVEYSGALPYDISFEDEKNAVIAKIGSSKNICPTFNNVKYEIDTDIWCFSNYVMKIHFVPENSHIGFIKLEKAGEHDNR